MSLTRWKSPGDANQGILDFRYGLLKSWKTGIRLAEILPGSGNQGININLVDSHVTGSGAIPYDALSYTWGGDGQIKHITCNGRRLAVTPTLLEALRRFRSRSEIVTLWVDQICICQYRILERNQQVQLMDKIFTGARKVIVWLGEDYEESKAGMALAKQLLSIARYRQDYGLTPSDFEAHGLPRRGHKKWAALSAILRRPWFWRTWVVQEVVLNPNVDLVLGSAVISWDDLESVVHLLEQAPSPVMWDFTQAIDASELPFSRINRIRQQHRGLLNRPQSRDTQLSNYTLNAPATTDPAINRNDEDDPELLDLLMMSRGLGATDPRDKIYALLGLSNHDILPDYSMTPESVFNSFAQQTVGVVTEMVSRRKAANLALSSHDREVRRAMILISCAGRHNQQLQLQSWVPDWTINLSSRPLIFGMDKRFCAGGERVAMFDWQPESGLELCGKFLDIVTVAGSIHLDYDLHTNETDKHDDIRRWMQEARQISDRRIARSLGSTGSTDAFDNLLRTLRLCKHGYYTGGTRRRRNSLFDDPDDFDESSHNAAYTLTLGPTRGRVFFVTATGYLGLGPSNIAEGDQIFVIMGGDVPWVLRPYEDAHELIGECYVQGAMDGEVMQMEHISVVDITIQ